MTGRWQDAILAKFVPKSDERQSILAIDPDGLMQDDTLIAELLAGNYDILPLHDEVDFRLAFERDYRSRWDQGEIRHLIVIVHTQNGHSYIPFDLYEKSERISLSVSDLFPRLNAIVVRGLDNAYYADLYPAHQANLAGQGVGRLGERETIEFILRAVFDLDPAATANSAQLTALLIKKHHSGRSLPPALETYLIEHILPRGKSLGLTAEHVTAPATFFGWLSERWTEYVDAAFKKRSPAIDFARPELRLLVDNLFADHALPRVPYSTERQIHRLEPEQRWITVGITLRATPAGPAALKESTLADFYTLDTHLSTFERLDPTDLNLREWLQTAAQWAEVVYLANRLPQAEYQDVQPRFFAQRAALDQAFLEFVLAKYASISFYDDNVGPISVARVNHWLQARHTPSDRVALLCFDGLALDQWLLMRDYLRAHFPALQLDETRIYAIAPTLTPVSRQALFAGDLPRAFSDTLHTTSKDGERWSRFWVNYEVPTQRVNYLHVRSDGQGLSELRAIVDSSNRRLGIVVNLFDDVMHATKGMTPQADKRVYYQTLLAHLDNSRLPELFRTLFEAGYQVYLTADHGNVAGTGMGLNPPKALLETYARRVVIFDSPSLAHEFAQGHELVDYSTKFLPADFLPIYAPSGKMFGAAGESQISHGGLSIEELIVPLITLRLA
jgi:hypothetical protein